MPEILSNHDCSFRPEYEIPLPTRGHVDDVPTDKCVAYGMVNTGKPANSGNRYGAQAYSVTMDNEYDTISV